MTEFIFHNFEGLGFLKKILNTGQKIFAIRALIVDKVIILLKSQIWDRPTNSIRISGLKWYFLHHDSNQGFWQKSSSFVGPQKREEILSNESR